MAVSVTDPLNPAYKRAAHITFKPFNLGKWFVLGLIAWLAVLDEGGTNFNFNFDLGPFKPKPPPAAPTRPPTTSPAELLEMVLAWLRAHIVEVVFIGAIAAILVGGLILLLLWINSRARFMLLRAIATDTYEVAAPWREFRALGNSLFGFRVALAILWSVAGLLILAAAAFTAWPDIRAKTFGAQATSAILIVVLLLFPTMIAFLLVSWLTTTFVTVIMYARGCTVMDGWRQFRANVLRGNILTLILFFLMNMVLALVAVMAHVLIGCVTCCVGFLPYLGTVATLPIVLFLRCYTIYFLQQFGPQYVIIHEAPPPPPPSAFPVIMPKPDPVITLEPDPDDDRRR
jgi:hypothetical protein